jgi:diguanylate cyclase (GGDEF)-like protein
MIFGAYTVVSNAKSKANRLFLLVTSSMAIWSFTYAISNSALTAEASAFWRCMSVFGWGFFHSFVLHFVLILTKAERRLNKQLMFAVLYVPVFINVILFAPFGFLAEKQYEMVPGDFGWGNTLTANIGQVWINVYYITYTAIAVILLISWWRKIESDSPLKRYVTCFLISILLPFLLGSITDILPGVLGLEETPRLAILFLILPTVFLFITLRKFNILIERSRRPFSTLNADVLPEEGRLRLFETAAAIFIIGAAGTLYVGYFIAGEDIARELLLAAAVLICGVFLRFIPHVTKNHINQNTLFLITGVTGMAFFIIKDVNIGASTVWAVYTIFLLYTVVLNSKIHAFIFLIATLMIQVVLWIIYPEVSTVIDNSQYMKRIFIIVLTYYAVQYLMGEYDSKLKGYQRFSEEQEVLEKISTNFISVNSENVKEKIDKMFKLSAQILDFDSAYLFEYDTSYENATIISMYVKDSEHKSSSFCPGTKFRTADFPEGESMIEGKSPILCEDVTNISTDMAKDQRDFFMSRGINSFFALPIIIDKRTTGFFVIEYRNRIDKKFTETRLHFLKIITNILGDAKEKTLYEGKLYESAYIDEITKLPNRNMLKKGLERILYNRNESAQIAILDIELENLRMINDTFGHSTGEQIIIESAKIIENLLKDCYYISRSGEGEFIAVMPFAGDTEQIEGCARRVIDAFSSPILTDTGIEALFVVVCIGISIFPEDGKDADTLLKNADLAGYEARTEDDKILFCTDQLKSRIAENTLFTNRLFQSLQNEEFFLEFQPQINCRTGKAVGAEALLRWMPDDNKRVPPDKFIPILEQTGLIHDVGLWVLEQTLKEHNRLIANGFPPLRFSVNLSVVQFRREDFIPVVSKLIEESRVDPKYIEMEITENMLSQNFADSIEKLFKLKELGISIAIDDFGKGYSSLHRLELVPFDRIKIDKSIIDNVVFERKKAAIVELIVSLARTLRVDITAEGVETEEQLDFLRGMACNEIQGFYFSRPLSVEALEEYLEA